MTSPGLPPPASIPYFMLFPSQPCYSTPCACVSLKIKAKTSTVPKVTKLKSWNAFPCGSSFSCLCSHSNTVLYIPNCNYIFIEQNFIARLHEYAIMTVSTVIRCRVHKTETRSKRRIVLEKNAANINTSTRLRQQKRAYAHTQTISAESQKFIQEENASGIIRLIGDLVCEVDREGKARGRRHDSCSRIRTISQA